MSEPEPEAPADEPAADEMADGMADEMAEPDLAPGEGETPEQKRARVMARLAEIIRSDPPQLSGGPVSPGGFPTLPESADEFDQEKATELFAALGQFFEQRKRPGDAGEDAETDPEPD